MRSRQPYKLVKKRVESVPRAVLTSFPANRRVKMRYSTTSSFACTAGAVGSHLFSLNSAYDPDYSGAGHQPLGFDQWSIFYRSYIVEKAKIRVEILNYSAFQAVAGVLLDNNASIPSTGDLIMEQPTCESRMVLAQNPTYTKPTVFTKAVAMKDWFNVTNVLDDVARFGAKTSADPTNICYCAIWGRELQAASTTTIYFKVLLEQTVVFSEPNDLPSS